MRKVADIVEALKADSGKMVAYWATRPDEFCRDVLRAEPQKWQRKFMTAIARARFGIPNDGDECKVRFAIKSGTGVGKTGAVAMLILWHLGVFPDSKIPCTAPTSPQIKAVLWPEIRKWVLNIPAELREWFPFEVQTDKVVIHENFAVARTAREENPEGFQGFHAKNIMLIADEASGVPDAIFLAGQGVMAEEGAITLLIGNPTRPVGWFFDAFHGDSHNYWTMTVACTDSERVPKKYVDDMKAKHGENSYEFRVRVMGEFHLEDSGLIIPRSWIEDAIERNVEPDSDWIVWGVDVSDGRDKSAISKRKGNILLEKPKAWGGKDIMQSVGVVVDEYFNCKRGEEPDEICVDAIGMGTAFAGRLAEALKGEPVKITRVNVALTGSQVNERYTSRRVELWARARAWFESGLCRIPQGCGTLLAQLSSVEWEVKDSNGKWAIIDKKAIGHSPDEADSFILTFGGVKGDKSSFTKRNKHSTFMRNNGANEYGLTSASYLQR